ncbi:MAG: sugar phosphate isomerase/epimerase family protein [Armatimonadota bacterium]
MTSDIRIAAHPYGYVRAVEDRNLYQAADRIFADLAEAGYDGIELMHTMLEAEEAVDRLEALSTEHDLPIIGTSFGGQMWDPDQTEEIAAQTERIAGQIQALGGHHLGISTGSTGKPKTQEQLDTQAALIRRMIEICKPRGITVDMHNHTYEVDWDLHELRGMIERMPELKLGPDLNWLRRAGVDPLQFLRTYADRIVFLHLRDQAGELWPQALGEGDEDWEAVAAVLDEIDFSGWAAVELAHEREVELTRPMGENYRLSLQHLRRAFHRQS